LIEVPRGAAARQARRRLSQGAIVRAVRRVRKAPNNPWQLSSPEEKLRSWRVLSAAPVFSAECRSRLPDLQLDCGVQLLFRF
jgi:hypothetical protein